jgi:hypothetical protein
MTADTLLLHPALARVDPVTRTWSAHVPLEDAGAYTQRSPDRRDLDTLSRLGLTIQGVSDTLRGWLIRRRVSAWDTRRGLIDTAGKQIWLVDFVCMLGPRCHLICLFHGNRRAIAEDELEYARTVKRLAQEVYRCDARVLAVKVYGEDRVFSKEIAAPQNARPAPV